MKGENGRSDTGNLRDLADQVGATELESVTSCMSSKRSNQLSYTPMGLSAFSFRLSARGWIAADACCSVHRLNVTLYDSKAVAGEQGGVLGG